jgi:hypothetical protein
MKRNNTVRIRTVLFGVMVVGALGVAPLGWCSTTISDNFNDGNDTFPTMDWQHYDPIGDYLTYTFSTPYTNAQWNFPGGNTYQIVASPPPEGWEALDRARAGSYSTNSYTNFYASVDVVDWSHTNRQVFGILARVGTPGPQTTSGYLFDWDSSDPNSTTAGDMDIVRIVDEGPIDLDGNTILGNDSIHLVEGHSYRFVFLGVSNTFRGLVYDLTNTVIPLVDYWVTDPAYDPNASDHVSGPVGLMVANNDGTVTSAAAATFDNFVASDGDLLTGNWQLLKIIQPSAGTVEVLWPWGGTLSLYGSPSLNPPSWGSALSPTGTNGAENVYTVSPATGMEFFKLSP